VSVRGCACENVQDASVRILKYVRSTLFLVLRLFGQVGDPPLPNNIPSHPSVLFPVTLLFLTPETISPSTYLILNMLIPRTQYAHNSYSHAHTSYSICSYLVLTCSYLVLTCSYLVLTCSYLVLTCSYLVLSMLLPLTHHQLLSSAQCTPLPTV